MNSISVGAVDRQGCRSHARDLSARNFRRRVSVSVSPWRGAVRTLFREVRTHRCIARYGHHVTRVGEAAHPGPTHRSMDATQATEASNPDSVHAELSDCLQEDLLLPGSRRRVLRRIRDSDSEDALVRDGESPGDPRQRFADSQNWRNQPSRRLVLVSSTQVDPAPLTVPDSVDSRSRTASGTEEAWRHRHSSHSPCAAGKCCRRF